MAGGGRPSHMERRVDRLGCDEIDIPAPVRRSIGMLMKGLKPIIAWLDFTMDVRGDWLLLESDQAGDFLWKEEVNAGIAVLDRATKLL